LANKKGKPVTKGGGRGFCGWAGPPVVIEKGRGQNKAKAR